VLLLVDSHPGGNGKELLTKCGFHGLYIYPSLPNRTSVKHTAGDGHNYGPFKSIIHDSLKRIASALYIAGEDIPLEVLTFGLIVYGSTILMGTTNITCRNALVDTFDIPSNLCSWSKVGAVPHTRKCITNPKVHHDEMEERNPNFDVFQDFQSHNNYSTALINVMGYRGDVLRVHFLHRQN
jgi:hypothetical protein